jgi:uncharacterized UBP type Zn finger protein
MLILTLSLGADITHPPSGSLRDPSFTSVVGSVDNHGVRYVSRIEVQAFRAYIENMEAMCVVCVRARCGKRCENHDELKYTCQHVFKQYIDATKKLPKRILFYRSK